MLKEKKYSVEILRSIAMMAVIILHFISYGNISNNEGLDGSNLFVTNLIYGMAIVAVNIYVLISGYFLYDKEFKVRRVSKVYIQTFFYSILIGLILMFVKIVPISIGNIAKTFFPFISQTYWFVNCYIILLVINPFLDIMLKKINKNQHFTLVMGLFIINSIISLLNKNPVSGVMSGLGIVWFINLYLIATYIRKYEIKIKNKYCILIYILGALILSISSIVISNLTIKVFGVSKYQYFLYDYNSPIVLLMSICVFILFLNMKKIYSEKEAKIINFISSSTFSVYLIHENPFIRDLIWNRIIKPSQYIGEYRLYIMLVLTTVLVFFVCILMDKILQKIYKKITLDFKFFNKLEEIYKFKE